jgi:hypothetical protein
MLALSPLSLFGPLGQRPMTAVGSDQLSKTWLLSPVLQDSWQGPLFDNFVFLQVEYQAMKTSQRRVGVQTFSALADAKLCACT